MTSFFASQAQTPCVNGFAGPYPCSGYDLQAEFSLNELNANTGNDSWGWTDPTNGKEYAIIGLDNGTAFIDISSPTNPVFLGKLPTHTDNSLWRDVKVYNNHAFIVSEADGHGMQVFDLTRLRNVNNPPQTFNADAHYNEFGNAHNIVINTDTGYAYAVGTQTFDGGPHFINIQDPLNPIAEGGYSMDLYSHDAQVVTYCGPDKDYSGREILIGSNEDEVVIVDITDKANPISISTISYENVAYTHQGWFTENQQYFILGDEIDELNIGFNTRAIIFDFTDLDNPQHHFEYSGPSPAIDHNGYVKGTKYYMANYRAGMRVIDVTDIDNQTMTEEGYFDSYPSNNNASFNGAWNVYPYFESGNIVISDIDRGFILVKASSGDTTPPNAICNNITVALDENGNASITANQLDNNSSDNSGVVYIQICDDTFTCDNIGDNQVTLEVYDDYGNKDYCTATVTIEDNLAPEINCPDDQSVGYNNGNSSYTLPDYAALNELTYTDNCPSGIQSTQTPQAGTQLTNGVYEISFIVTDASGNESTCSFDLTVDDSLGIPSTSNQTSLKIYPNPSNGSLNIEANTIIHIITIVDVSGKVIFKQQESSETTQTNLSLDHLSKGIYFVILNENTTKKFIKI